MKSQGICYKIYSIIVSDCDFLQDCVVNMLIFLICISNSLTVARPAPPDAPLVTTPLYGEK